MRRIETASRPSASATSTAAATIASRLSRGFGTALMLAELEVPHQREAATDVATATVFLGHLGSSSGGSKTLSRRVLRRVYAVRVRRTQFIGSRDGEAPWRPSWRSRPRA